MGTQDLGTYSICTKPSLNAHADVLRPDFFYELIYGDFSPTRKINLPFEFYFYFVSRPSIFLKKIYQFYLYPK